MPFLPPKQQCQSTEGKTSLIPNNYNDTKDDLITYDQPDNAAVQNGCVKAKCLVGNNQHRLRIATATPRHVLLCAHRKFLHTSQFNDSFIDELGDPISLQFSSITCCGREPLGISGRGFSLYKKSLFKSQFSTNLSTSLSIKLSVKNQRVYNKMRRISRMHSTNLETGRFLPWCRSQWQALRPLMTATCRSPCTSSDTTTS